MSETTALVEHKKTGLAPQTFLAARTADEMQAAQTDLCGWLRAKLDAERQELKEMNYLLKNAKKCKWNTKGLRGRVQRQERRVEFYKKCLKASELGYCIIPEFPVDVVAIRTVRDHPVYQGFRREGGYSVLTRTDLAVENGQELPAGKGRFVSALPTGKTWTTEEEKDGKRIVVSHVETACYTDPEFPVTVATPVIMQATGRAMLEEIFDDIAVCPSTGRGKDPLVIGRIHTKQGYSKKTMNFLIAWCLDLRRL